MIAAQNGNGAALAGNPVCTANQSADNSTQTFAVSPREFRLLMVLKANGRTSRHDLDSLAGYENTPDGVMNLRRRLGFDLPMEKRPFVDRDGRKVRIGYYDLSDADRAKLLAAGIA